MIEKLDTLGFENEVFVPVYDRNIAVIQPNDNVCVCECFRKWDRILFRYKQRKILRAIEAQYDMGSFDLIHAYTTFTDGNVARMLSEKYGVPYVVAVRNTDINTFFKYMFHLRKLGQRVLNQAEQIFFLSDPYKECVLENYIAASDKPRIRGKSRMIPNGINDFWLLNRSPVRTYHASDRIRLVYAGVIDRNKNIETTQCAMALLQKEGIHSQLTVVGKCVDKTVFNRILSNPHTTHIPHCGKEALIDIYRNHDIFVMPSIHETFGLVYAEAMSQGLPVIYTRGQGFDGQFPEGAVGYAVSAHDEREIADAIMKICADYENMSARCTELCQKFSWDAITEQYAAIYAHIMEKEDR
ncbi:MAG: glycosyltransferase family 4 protein [Eubacteriales bacterium]|nr:glycosyltransferase family 4 protein [Eubacteriales bacterium]